MGSQIWPQIADLRADDTDGAKASKGYSIGQVRGGAGNLTAVDSNPDDLPAGGPGAQAAGEPGAQAAGGPGGKARPKRSRRWRVTNRLVLWGIFGVIIGCLPILANVLKLSLSAGGLSINALFAQGDLFVIAAILAAGAIGEIMFAQLSDAERSYGLAAAGFCLLFSLLNAAGYAFSTITAACEQAEETTINATTASSVGTAASAQRVACDGSAALAHPGIVAHLSLVLFLITTAFSAVCIGMAAWRVEE